MTELLDRYAAATQVAPSPDLAQRIQARIAQEPASTPPRRFFAALGAFAPRSAFGAFRQSVGAAVGRGRFPVMVRAQALGLVLLVALSVGALGAGGAVVLRALVLQSDRPSPTIPEPTTVPPEATESLSPVPTAKSRPDVIPNDTPTPRSDTLRPTPDSNPNPTQKVRHTSGPGATPEPDDTPTAKPTKTPRPTPKPTPKPTRTPRPTHTPKPTRTPRPTHTPKPTHTPRPTQTPHGGDEETPEPTDTPESDGGEPPDDGDGDGGGGGDGDGGGDDSGSVLWSGPVLLFFTV